MADSIVYENQPAYGTWLIPIIIFGALAFIGIFVFLRFFFKYGCSCERDQGVGEVEERGTSRAVLRKGFRGPVGQHTGPGSGVLHPHMMLFPPSEHDIPARPVYQHDPYIYPQSSYPEESIYKQSYRRAPYPQQAVYFQQLYTPPLYPQEYQTPPPVYEQSQGFQTPQVFEQLRKYERRSPVSQSFPKLHPSDSNESIRLAYDDFPSMPSVSSQSSSYHGDQSFQSGRSSMPTLYSQGSYYPLDSILSRLRNNASQSFSSDSPSLEVPKLKFTPPSIKDIASLALGSVCSVEDLLQAPDVDRFGRAVPQSRSVPEMPSPSKPKSRNLKFRCNRAIAIIGNNILIEGTNERHLENSLRNVLGEVQQNINTGMKKRRRKTGGVYNGANQKENHVEEQNSRRKSFMVKVFVPFTNDLWKFWVTRNETLAGFTRRVREKCGFEVGLFKGEEMLATEEDWKLVSGGIKITAQPL